MKSEREKLSREQRIRKQAELQSLYSTLSNLRGRELSYMEASARIPRLVHTQIDGVRQKMVSLEEELAGTTDEDPAEAKGRRFYAEAFEAERAGELEKALGIYKKASRYSHSDAAQAIRSVRYQIKRGKTKTAEIWLPTGPKQHGNRLLWLFVLALLAIILVIFWLNWPATLRPQTTLVVVDITPNRDTPTVVVQLIIPDTPTPFPTATATLTSVPTPLPTPTPTDVQTQPAAIVPPEATDTPVPTPVPTLKPAPKLIGPRDGLVWLDGAVVFEFEAQNLDFDELYCLTSMRGYDYNNAENWSYPPVGNKSPSIVLEANIFRIAKIQGMQCVLWSAGIGKGSCENIVSQTTVPRVIGLPRPCDF
jgi:hypothetical protein